MGCNVETGNDELCFDDLWSSLASAQAEVRVAREIVIEKLGDRMCGTGSGPTVAQLEALTASQRRVAEMRRDMSRLLALLARRVFSNMQQGAPRAESRPSAR